MKKIICLFLFGTTFLVNNLLAVTSPKSQTESGYVIALKSHDMALLKGGAKNVLVCVGGFLALGAAMATLATATGGFIGPMVVFTLNSTAAFAVIGDACNN